MQTITTEKELDAVLSPLLDGGAEVQFKIIHGGETHEYDVAKLDEPSAGCAGGRKCVSRGIAEFSVNCEITDGGETKYETYAVCAMCAAEEIALFSGMA